MSEKELIKPEDFTPEFYTRYGVKNIQISLDILHCNARCEFCYLPPTLQRVPDAGLVLRNDQRNMELLEAFVINFVNSRTPVQLPIAPIDFVGGEVTMYPHNIVMLKEWFKKAPNLRLHVVTNGLFFRRNWAQFAIDTNSVCDFSINGYDEKSHTERMQMGNTWNTVIKNIKDYMKMSGFCVAINFVISPKTIKQRYFTKIVDMFNREFISQGYTNFKVNFHINIADAHMSFEKSFTDPSLTKEDFKEMEEIFLEEVPILDSIDLLDERKIRLILTSIKSSQEVIDKVIASKKRLVCNSRMTNLKDTEDNDERNMDPDPYGLEYFRTIYEVDKIEAEINQMLREKDDIKFEEREREREESLKNKGMAEVTVENLKNYLLELV